MAWGARQHDDGTWRLCERKGPTLLTLHKKAWPGVEVKFASQAKTKKCADQLNELYWKTYEKARRNGWSGSDGWYWNMVNLIHEMGGISAADYERITTQ